MTAIMRMHGKADDTAGRYRRSDGAQRESAEVCLRRAAGCFLRRFLRETRGNDQESNAKGEKAQRQDDLSSNE
jgi:hypothetical protein